VLGCRCEKNSCISKRCGCFNTGCNIWCTCKDCKKPIAISTMYDKDLHLWIFDTEATHKDTTIAHITDIGAVYVNTMEEYSAFVNPGMHIPQMVVDLTGITNEMVKDAPLISKSLELFEAFILTKCNNADKVYFLAHNGNSFDTKVLETEYRRIGRPMPTNWIFLDSLPIIRRALQRQNKTVSNFQLATLAQELLNEPVKHQAIADVRSLLHILQHVLQPLYPNHSLLSILASQIKVSHSYRAATHKLRASIDHNSV
jgi:DNA polymerase III alpha subunit (gram-positive type)